MCVCTYLLESAHTYNLLWFCTWTALWTEGVSKRVSYFQETGYEQRSGKAVTIHSFTASFQMKYLCAHRYKAQYFFLSARFVCFNEYRPQLEATGFNVTLPVQSGKGFCQHLKYLWPHWRESCQGLNSNAEPLKKFLLLALSLS